MSIKISNFLSDCFNKIVFTIILNVLRVDLYCNC